MSLDSYIASNRARAEQAANDAEAAANSISESLVYKNAGNYLDNASDGGEAIQDAIDDLPAKGGKIIIPADGPDDGVDTNGKTLSEDGVWKIRKPIMVDKPGVTIEGEAHGTMDINQDASSGTVLLTPDSSATISKMFHFTSCGGCAMRDMRLDGGTGGIANGNVNYGIEIDNEKSDAIFPFLLDNVYVAHQNLANLRLNGVNGIPNIVKVSNSTLTDCSGANIVVDEAASFSRLQLNNITSSLSGRLLDLQDEISDVLVNNTLISANQNATTVDAFRINANIDSLYLNNIYEAGYDNSFLKVESGATIEAGGISNTYVTGMGRQNYFIDNQGSIKDFDLGSGIRVKNLTGSKYNNFKNDINNTSRITIGGLGYNGSNDPSSAGDWNGNGEEGVRVLWDNRGYPTIAEYVDGTWYNRSL